MTTPFLSPCCNFRCWPQGGAINMWFCHALALFVLLWQVSMSNDEHVDSLCVSVVYVRFFSKDILICSVNGDLLTVDVCSLVTPASNHYRFMSTWGASCARSMRMTASLTSLNAAGMEMTGEDTWMKQNFDCLSWCYMVFKTDVLILHFAVLCSDAPANWGKDDFNLQSSVSNDCRTFKYVIFY